MVQQDFENEKCLVLHPIYKNQIQLPFKVWQRTEHLQ
jgi:hypothetical protein